MSVCRSASNEFYRSLMLLVVYICCYYYCSLDYQIILQLFCISQLRQQLYRSQCQPVGLSVRNEFYESVMLFHIFSYECSSIGHNVSMSVCMSATSFMEVLCCCECMIVVTIVVLYIYRIFCCYVLHFKLQQQL